MIPSGLVFKRLAESDLSLTFSFLSATTASVFSSKLLVIASVLGAEISQLPIKDLPFELRRSLMRRAAVAEQKAMAKTEVFLKRYSGGCSGSCA